MYVVCSTWIVSTRPALERARKVKTMNRSQAKKSVQSVRRPFVCLFLLHFAPVSKCLFWYVINRQILLWEDYQINSPKENTQICKIEDFTQMDNYIWKLKLTFYCRLWVKLLKKKCILKIHFHFVFKIWPCKQPHRCFDPGAGASYAEWQRWLGPPQYSA